MRKPRQTNQKTSSKNTQIKKPPIVPPIKCQGIKTKLTGNIKALLPDQFNGVWIEPFLGSSVVALNVQPRRAILADTNRHIIGLYSSIQNGEITPTIVKDYLIDANTNLLRDGADYYYQVRDRFNKEGNSLDFLFLNRACFNGVMRFNSKGKFNVPFCKKDNRFAQAYVTKIVNQVKGFVKVLEGKEWEFITSSFENTLARAQPEDIVYADPPYLGRHTDYFNTWDEETDHRLNETLHNLPCRFIYSTWHSNDFRCNYAIQEYWTRSNYHILKREHFYHVGSSEDLRNPVVEAIVINFPLPATAPEPNAQPTPARAEPPQLIFQFEAASAG